MDIVGRVADAGATHVLLESVYVSRSLKERIPSHVQAEDKGSNLFY
jgi:hypothetical protein